MRARLQLARALLPKPPVLILDEPTGPVDPVSAHSFLETLQTITAEEGTAVLLSSHRLEEIDALSESVALLSEGRIIFRGDLEHLRAISERPRFEIDFVDEGAADAASAILAEEFARDPEAIVDRRGSTLVISVDRPPGQILRGLGDHVDDVTSIVEGRMPLRDLFVHVLSTNSRTSEPSR
jgi:ABC-2 type transport system ATP-binding protein